MDMEDTYEQDGDQIEGDEGGSSAAVSSLTGFLFGNIDEKGELQEDFLDEVILQHQGTKIPLVRRPLVITSEI